MDVVINKDLKLCAGTFFLLLLKTNENSESSQDLRFKYFLRVIDPQAADLVSDGMVEEKFHTYASKLRNCNPLPKGKYIRFGDPNICTYFKDELKENKMAGLDRVVEFCDKFVPENTRPWLVRSVLELIELDESIGENDVFYIKPGFAPAYRSEIFREDTDEINISFYDFLLGIWFFIYEHYQDNTEGKKTIETLSGIVKGSVQREFYKNLIGSDERYPHVNISYEIGAESLSESDDTKVVIPEVAETLVYMTKDDIAPDLGQFDPEKDIIFMSAEEANDIFRGKFAKYLAASYKKHSMKRTFVYETERPFREFYVCNNIQRRIRGSVSISNSGSFAMRNSRPPIKNVGVNDFSGLKTLICGQGGLGKTMLMYHLFLKTIEDRTRDPYIPIFVSLTDYIPGQQDLLFLINQAVTRYDTKLQLSDVTAQLEEGQNVILLDGLDEISGEYINKFAKELEIFTDSYQDNAFIVSSRNMPETRLLNGFETYDLLPLEEEQAFEMINKLDPAYIDDTVKKGFIFDVKKGRFRFNAQEKEEFFGNPLFLTIMIISYSQTNNIPTQRYLFYEQAYRAMATRHDALKGITRNFFTGLNERDFQRVFGHFCADSYVDHNLKFTRVKLDRYLQKVIDEEKMNTDVDMFFKDIVQKLCLMFLDGSEYKFIHRSFQEYFAAYYFTTLMDEEYADVYDAIRAIDREIISDETIPMLFGLDKKKCEKYIILPFLESIVDAQENKIDEEYDEEYREFLPRFYSSIEFATGELDDDFTDNRIQSALYKFVVEHYDIQQYISSSDFDNDESWADDTEQYYLVEDYRGGPDHESSSYESDIWQYTDEAGNPYDGIHIEEAGVVGKIDTNEVTRNSSLTGEDWRWETFKDSVFPLRIEFDEIIKLELRLKEEYATETKKKKRFGLN